MFDAAQRDLAGRLQWENATVVKSFLTLRVGSSVAHGPTESYNTSLERSKLNLVRFEPKNHSATSEIL